jgi:DNA-binding NarL/FixJ family response regulator
VPKNGARWSTEALVNVFIVEDSVSMRSRLTAALEEVQGVRVVGEADGADAALFAIERLRPDLVIVDLRLAEGSGLTVIEDLKRLHPAPIVAVLTNYPYPQYRARCLALGADYFFDKAAGLDALLEVCRGAGPVREDHRASA